MSYGQGRFLTTHIGSLPRPEDLMELMFAREDGLPLEASAVDARVRAAVQEVVQRQVEAGIDIVNDGEMSKPSYATYIKDRLNGFGGTGNSFAFQDLEDYPGVKARVFADPGRKHRKTPACNGPISVKDMDAVRRDALRDERLAGRGVGHDVHVHLRMRPVPVRYVIGQHAD